MRHVLPPALPATGVLLSVACVVGAVAALLWPDLAAASTAGRPETLGSVVLDGLLCFGPLGAPLAGVGAVVVGLERKR